MNEDVISRCRLRAGSRGATCADVRICFFAPTFQQPGATVDGLVRRWLVDIPGR